MAEDFIEPGTAEELLAFTEKLMGRPYAEQPDAWLDWEIDGRRGRSAGMLHMFGLADLSDADELRAFAVRIAAGADRRWGERRRFDATSVPTQGDAAWQRDPRVAPAMVLRAAELTGADWWLVGEYAVLLTVVTEQSGGAGSVIFVVLGAALMHEQAPYERADAAERRLRQLGSGWAETYVQPFYLSWMSANVLRTGLSPAPLEMLPAIRARAAELDRATISTMLGAGWRNQVMGCWYAVAQDDPSLADAVNDSLDLCFGHLTSAPFAVAAVRLADHNTVRALRAFRDRYPTSERASVARMVAALARLHALEPGEAVDPVAANELEALLEVAEELAARGR